MTLIRSRAPSDELDYSFVMDCLSEYSSPRVKLHQLLKAGALVRVKKGFYVFGKDFTRHPRSLELLANKIYGPSYISLEWALAFYSLIPEKVETITSVTWKRKREFDTPLGRFSYDHIAKNGYPPGITRKVFSEYQSALIATKEKALTDFLVIRRGRSASIKACKQILFEDLRIEPEDLLSFDLDRLLRIYKSHPHTAVEHFIKIIEKAK